MIEEENAVDHCESNPCRNGATCTNEGDGFKCRCAPGFRGRTCDTGKFLQHFYYTPLTVQIFTVFVGVIMLLPDTRKFLQKDYASNVCKENSITTIISHFMQTLINSMLETKV